MRRLSLTVPCLLLIIAGTACGADFDSAKLAAIRTRMQSFVDQSEVAGVVTLVATHDRVVSLESVGYQDLASKKPMRKDCLFRIASMTKPITAIGLMILVDEGKLSVDDPVEKYIPEFRGQPLAGQGNDAGKLAKPSRPITLRDLLTHSSGMPGGLPPEPTDLYAKRNHTLAEVVPLFGKVPLQFEPGTKWQYCNIGIDTVGRIIEVVSGQQYEEFLEKRVFGPLKMADTTFYPTPAQRKRVAQLYNKEHDKLVATDTPIVGPTAGAKYPIPSAGLYSTASDLARLYQMMLNGGQLDGRRILSKTSVKEMTRLSRGEMMGGGLGYGLGFAVVGTPGGIAAKLSPATFGHGGAFGTQGWIDPKQDLILVLLFQRVGIPNGDSSDIRRVFQEAAIEAMTTR